MCKPCDVRKSVTLGVHPGSMVVVKFPLRPHFFTFRVNVLGPGAQHAQPDFYLSIYETMIRLRLEKLNFIFNNITITQIQLF